MQRIAQSEKAPDNTALEKCPWDAANHPEPPALKCWNALNEWLADVHCNYLISNEFLFE